MPTEQTAHYVRIDQADNAEHHSDAAETRRRPQQHAHMRQQINRRHHDRDLKCRRPDFKGMIFFGVEVTVFFRSNARAASILCAPRPYHRP